MRKRRSLWWGTLTLTGAAFASRGLGLIYRMLLARFLGSEGLGFFQMVFPLYIALVTLAVMGTPVAVSQLVAEGRARPSILVRKATTIVLAISVPLGILVVTWARPLALTLYHDPRFVPMVWALSPALVAVAFSSVLRGYFIGQQQMEYPAVSQVAEQMARVAILFSLLNLIGQQAFHNAPLIAVLLIPFGEAISLSILAYAYMHQPDRGTIDDDSPSPRFLVRDILKLSVPVTLNRLLGSAIGVVEASLIPIRLQASGLTESQAVRYFGTLTGMALPLIFFPTALTVSLSTNLVPAIAEAHAQNDSKAVSRLAVDSFKATALLTVPVTFVLLTMGIQLDDFFFSAHVSSLVFVPLVLGAFFLYFDIALSGILRGLGRTDIPLRNDIISSLLELALIWLLAPQPHYGQEGVALSLAIGFFVSFMLNLFSTMHLTEIRFPLLTIFGKPVVAGFPLLLIIPYITLFGTQHHFARPAILLFSLILAAGMYFVSLSLTGVRWTRLF